MAMLSHVSLGIADYERALAFYAPLMERLGLRLRFAEPDKHWAGWTASDGSRPIFFITRPFDGDAPAPGNGPMVAFDASDRATVDAIHALALEMGGSDEGAPGLRPHYHPDYYGAYFRDPDGNKLCVVCHSPTEPQAARR